MHRKKKKNTEISENKKAMVYGCKTYRNKIAMKNKKD
jgi:hypothetical protein